MICELENPYILIINKKIENLQQIIKLLELIMQTSKQLLIIADDIEGEALATLIINKIRGGLKIAAVKAPGFGETKREILQDISILTGSKFIDEYIEEDKNNIDIKQLGKAKKVIITKEETTIIQNK